MNINQINELINELKGKVVQISSKNTYTAIDRALVTPYSNGISIFNSAYHFGTEGEPICHNLGNITEVKRVELQGNVGYRVSLLDESFYMLDIITGNKAS